MKVSTDGLMTSLSFEENGSPTYAEFDIVNLGRTGFIQVAYYISFPFYLHTVKKEWNPLLIQNLFAYVCK